MAKNKHLTSQAIATRQAVEWFSQIWGLLPNPDVVLQKSGKDISAYADLLYDPHTSACIESRKSGTLSLEWTLQAEKNDALAVLLQERLEQLNVYRVIEEMLNAPLFGFQPLEVEWELVNNLLLPRRIEAKPQKWFGFDDDNALRLKTIEAPIDGIELPPYRFLTVQHRATYENPYGTAILSRVFWAQFWKRNVQRFWNTFAEKFGTPWVVLHHPYGGTDNETRAKINALVSSVRDMVQDAVIGLPQGANAELESVSGTANADMYKLFLDFCNAEISKAILGQTLSTETQKSGGSYAATKAHLEVRKEIIESDKRLIEESFNRLVGWVYELNRPAGTAVPEFLLYETTDVDKVKAERDKILHDVGVRFTEQYFVEQYGLKTSDFTLQSATQAVSAPASPNREPISFAADSFADTVQNGLDAAVNGTSAEEWQAQAIAILEPLLATLKTSSSAEDAKKKLLEAWGRIDTKRFDERLRNQMALVRILGVLSIEDEAGADFSDADFSETETIPMFTSERLYQAFNLEPRAALEFLFGKESRIVKSYKGIPAEVLRHIFTVSGIMRMDVISAIRKLIEQAVKEGQSFEEWKRAMTASELIRAVLPERRLQVIYRTNLQSAFMAARYTEQIRIAERKPYWQFVAVLDQSTTQGCKDLNGRIFRYDDDFWALNYPPRHYACRSRVIALNERELARYGGEVELGSMYTNIKPEPSFAARPTDIYMPEREKYDADIFARFERSLQNAK